MHKSLFGDFLVNSETTSDSDTKIIVVLFPSTRNQNTQKYKYGDICIMI